MEFDPIQYLNGDDSFKVNHIHSLLKEKGLTIENTHDQYWKYRKKVSPNLSHIDAYSYLAFNLFVRVVNWSTDLQLTVNTVQENSFLWNDIRESVIIALIHEQNTPDAISELIFEYQTLTDREGTGSLFLIDFIEYESSIAVPLTTDQSSLQEVFSLTNLRIVPKFNIREDGSKSVNYSMSYVESYLPPNHYQEQLYQLYLLGDKVTQCSSYMGLLDPEVYNNNMTFDYFIIQFWEWAQRQKKSYPVPDYLKEFCIKVLAYVVQNNSIMKKRSKDFSVFNIQDSWDKFRWFANDARRRLREKERKL